MNFLDRFIAWMSPSWGQSRARARLMARHFEAASIGRRTDGWPRRLTDANTAASGPTLAFLRAQARDLVRNNPWARQGLRLIATDVVGWGIRPKAMGRNAERVMQLWKLWAETTQCDAAGQLDFYGLQWLAMRTVAQSGEVLIRRRMRRPGDGLAIPMQLQVLEPDYIDTSKDGIKGPGGGDIVQGVEFDPIGRRVAYWLFDQHPGSRSLVSPVSKRVPADGILHVYDVERPGQVRGPSWFASVDVRLHEFDEFEGATLMKQKIAACMAAFVTDLDGTGVELGKAGTDKATGQPTDAFEPGMILNLPAGKQVTVANPPTATDHQSFSATALRGVAAGLGVTYEALTGDYSQVNYSSARMGRNVYNANVNNWRWKMLIPQFCAPAWAWVINAMIIAGEEVDNEPATWTPPPLPMLDPEKEGSATTKAVRAGQMTHDEMIREQGYDPEDYWREYADSLKRLDEYGIVLDSDPRKTTSGGQLQPPPPSPAPPDTAARMVEQLAQLVAQISLEREIAQAERSRLAKQQEAFQLAIELHERTVADMKEAHARGLDALMACHARELNALEVSRLAERAEAAAMHARDREQLRADQVQAIADLQAEHRRTIADHQIEILWLKTEIATRDARICGLEAELNAERIARIEAERAHDATPTGTAGDDPAGA